MEQALITTSWDDGYPRDLRVAELLNKYGLTGTFYVPKSAERKVINTVQIRRLADTFEVGAHTVHHTVLTTVSDETAREEIQESKYWIEDVVGDRCPLFCFPQGKFRVSHLRMVRQAGFEAARTVAMMSLARPHDIGELNLIPTTIQAFPHPVRVYLANSVKRRQWNNLVHLFRSGWTSDWVQQADHLLQHVVRHGGVFHLWGHSWEIEEYNLWKDLEHVFTLMGQYDNQVSFVTNEELSIGTEGEIDRRKERNDCGS